MFRLRLQDESRPPYALEPGRTYTAGRGETADLSFPGDNSMSRLQAEIAWNGSSWVLRNRSQHGSWVRGEKVEGERILVPGDDLLLGGTRFVFEAGPATAPVAPLGPVPADPRAAVATPPPIARPGTSDLAPGSGAHGVVAPASAGYDEQGVFHMGYTLAAGAVNADAVKAAVAADAAARAAAGGAPVAASLPAAPPPKIVPKTGAFTRNVIFFVVMVGMALLGTCCLSLTVVHGALTNVPGQFVIASIIAFLPCVPYLALYKFFDRNAQIPMKNYLACFFWGATVGCGFSVVFNDLTNEIFTNLAGGQAASLVTCVLAAPFFEETTKGLAIFVVFLILRDEFDNAVEGLLLGAASGIGFALVENCVYFTRFLTSEGLGGFLVLGTFRTLTCALIGHPIYTAMTGLGFGLCREWGKSPVRFLLPPLGWFLAMAMHASWNGSAAIVIPLVFGNHEMLGLAALTIFVGGTCLFFFVGVLVYSLVKERRILQRYLGDEVERGFIEADELASFASLFGREKFVFGGWRLGSFKLRKELRRAQLDLAFRKWHLEQGDRVKGQDVDQDLLDARIRIRDARNALNAKEGRVRAKTR